MMNYFEDYELDEFPFDDEEDLCLPKKGNSMKSMLPLDIYKIVEMNSSARRPLRIMNIVDLLGEYPYDLKIDRKAVSRHLANIILRYPEIRYKRNVGVWYEEQRPYRAA